MPHRCSHLAVLARFQDFLWLKNVFQTFRRHSHKALARDTAKLNSLLTLTCYITLPLQKNPDNKISTAVKDELALSFIKVF